jgi:hypothetical protein
MRENFLMMGILRGEGAKIQGAGARRGNGLKSRASAGLRRSKTL